MKRPRRQAKMQVWHPKARFETIAVDVLEISPTSATGMKKVVVIGDVFSRFMMAIAVPAETAAAIAEVLFEVDCSFRATCPSFVGPGECFCVGGCAKPLRESGD
jgi:hypothetical protein